jgi:hypothetical protein
VEELIPYLATVIGFLIVWVLNEIKAEIREVKTTVKSLEKDLGTKHSDLEARVIKLESGCEFMHRRHDD